MKSAGDSRSSSHALGVLRTVLTPAHRLGRVRRYPDVTLDMILLLSLCFFIFRINLPFRLAAQLSKLTVSTCEQGVDDEHRRTNFPNRGSVVLIAKA